MKGIMVCFYTSKIKLYTIYGNLTSLECRSDITLNNVQYPLLF